MTAPETVRKNQRRLDGVDSMMISPDGKRYILGRSEQLRANPPENWDGAWIMTSK